MYWSALIQLDYETRKKTLKNNFSTGKIPTAENFANLIKSSCNAVIVNFKTNTELSSTTYIVTLGYYYKGNTAYQIPIEIICCEISGTNDTTIYYYLDSTKGSNDGFQRLNSWFTSILGSTSNVFTESNIYTIESANAFSSNIPKFYFAASNKWKSYIVNTYRLKVIYVWRYYGG